MQLDVLCCPRCKSSKLSTENTVGASATKILCDECKHQIPLFDNLYCFMAHPTAYQIQWRARHNALAGTIQNRERHAKEKTTPDHPLLTKNRLDRIFQSQKKNLQRLTEILPELLGGQEPPLNLIDVVASKISRNQSFDNYVPNIFRDWVWGEKENAAALAALKPYFSTSDDTQQIAVLGSGSGRLATDLARVTKSQVYALDTNPLLLRIHSLMIGESKDFEFDELPINPRSLDLATVTQKLKGQPCANVYPIIMNALNPSFRRGSLDVILASWFIDVVPEDFLRLSARLNASLKTNGRFIIHGPLGFSDSTNIKAYTKEEVCEILELNGFHVEENKTVESEYLNSEYNPQKRSEEVKIIIAKKIKNVKEPSEFKLLPEWLVQTNKPIAADQTWSHTLAQFRLRYELLAAVDGKKSFDDIALLVERHYKIQKSEARALVVNLMSELFELA
jgi:uncharacterized protein YbaR (Trm112 family)